MNGHMPIQGIVTKDYNKIWIEQFNSDPNFTPDDMQWIDNYFSRERPLKAFSQLPGDEDIEYLNELSKDEENNRKGVKHTMPKAIDYNDYDMPGGDGGTFLKLDLGETRIRIVSEPYEVEYHEFKEGNDYSTKLCQGDKCEHCDTGNKKKVKIAYVVLNRKDSKPYIMECKKSVFDQIKAYAVNAEYGDPMKYDLTIIKSGEKLNTKYQVVASPKQSEITKEELEVIGESGISIEKTYETK